MPQPFVLASGSETRARLLAGAGIAFDIVKPRIDEQAIRASLEEEGATSRDLADALAEMKARKVAEQRPEALVLGCDQVLDFDGRCMAKAASIDEARAQLRALSGHCHSLLSAIVLYQGDSPVWRHVGLVRLQMRKITDSFLDDYLARNWGAVRHAVGCYKLEEEGARFFTRIEGDYFTVLGLPLIPLLSYLVDRGEIAA